MAMTVPRLNFGRFRNDESGAVTVDWVVLTAALAVLAFAVVTTILGDISGVADRIANAVPGLGAE